MKFILDTSAYSAFNRGDNRLQPLFQSKNSIIVPLIVVGELRAGFAAGTKVGENEKLLQRFLDAPNVQALTITDATTQRFAEVYLGLRSADTPIGTNDMWIAALTLEHEAPLLTLDRDFAFVPNIKLVTI